jgi:hypothetical protein
MTIQSSTTAAEKNFGFNYNDVSKFNALMNGGTNGGGSKKILGPLSQSKLSYYSNYTNNYLNQSPNKISNGVKKLNAQQNNFSNGIQPPPSNSKTSNYSTTNKTFYQQQQHVLRSNSNASELRVYDQNDDIDEYYPQVYANGNSKNYKSKLPLPSLPKNTPHNYGKIVIKQQNVNLNTENNFPMKKSPIENNDSTKKTTPIQMNAADNTQIGRKTNESFYNLNGAHGNAVNNYNGKILVSKKKKTTTKPSVFSPELVVGNTSNGHGGDGHYQNGHAIGPMSIDNSEVGQRQRSMSLLNGGNKARVSSSTNSSNSSSCSTLINSIEETENIYDLNELLKKYLNKIEKNYSLDKLYAFVKTNIKYNGYKNFTLDSLEAHLAPLSNLGTKF